MPRIPLTLMSVLPIAVLALGGCDSFSPDRVETLTHAPEVRSLSINLRNGAIEVSRDDAISGIEVKAEIRAYGETVATAKERADATKVAVAPGEGGRVTVRVEFPAPYHRNDSASVSIRAGRLETMSLVTANGPISADGCAGPITARTSNGAIDIKEHAGPTTAETSNGQSPCGGSGDRCRRTRRTARSRSSSPRARPATCRLGPRMGGSPSSCRDPGRAQSRRSP